MEEEEEVVVVVMVVTYGLDNVPFLLETFERRILFSEWKSFFTQEQDMLVLSKECLFILSHVYQLEILLKQENNLTLMAAKTIQSSRLVGHVYKDPFKILFDNYSKDTKKYLFLLLEEFSSIFMAIQDINKKCQKISSLSENLITVAKNIVNEFNTKFSANFVSRGTSLFEDETVEWHRTLFEESRRYARLLMFRGQFFGTTLY